jgi:hypothetical protein
MNSNLISALRNMADDIGNIGASPFTVDLILIQQAIAALEPQWQPIESAPRDGSFYLGTDGRNQRVENCPEGYDSGVWHLIDGEWRGSEFGPDSTHWQPLPAPPEVVG